MAQLLKVHGSFNHFFLLDQTTLPTPLSDPALIRLAQHLTDPGNGFLHGADGLLVVNRSEHPGVLGQMRVINADGSEASMCGNGLRTVARYLSEKTGQTNFKVETRQADLAVRKETDFATQVPAFAVEISPVRFNAAALPFTNLGRERIIDDLVPELAPGLRFTSLAVPNPHLVAFGDEALLTGPLMGELGAFLNQPNPYYPDGVNLNFAKILGEDELFVRTYERGVGFTNACGTGMSATSLAFALTHPTLGHFETPITVYNPGGLVKTLLHSVHHHYQIELIGNATVTHQLEIADDLLAAANFTTDQVVVTETGEDAAYQQFVATLPTPVKVAVKD